MTKTSYGLVIKGDAELQRVEIHFPPTPVSNSYNRITTPTDLIHMVLRLTLFDSRPLKLIACDLALDGGTDEDLAEPPMQLTMHIQHPQSRSQNSARWLLPTSSSKSSKRSVSMLGIPVSDTE